MDNLLPGQKSQERPHLVTRMFHQELKNMITLLKEGAIQKNTGIAILYRVPETWAS